MRQRTVILSPEAEDDLIKLYEWIAERAGPTVAIGYIERIESFCARLDIASERGTTRDDIRAGLRIVGFERRVTVAFTVTGEDVQILRLYYGGRDWEASF